VAGPEPRVVYAVHKPAGVISTARDTHGRPAVVGLVPDAGVRLYPVGRLDADATGLLLLTNDGELAHGLTHPRHEIPKTYRVRVRTRGGRVPERALRALREGVELEDGRTAPARVRQVEPGVLELTIHEGRNRQVKRMCRAVGHDVIALHRIRFGPLELGDLAPGRARRLTRAEVERLRAAVRAGARRAGRGGRAGAGGGPRERAGAGDGRTARAGASDGRKQGAGAGDGRRPPRERAAGRTAPGPSRHRGRSRPRP
jgi:23S rRNA pseudouridine2605 synthase